MLIVRIVCLVYFLTNDFLWTIFSFKLLIHWGTLQMTLVALVYLSGAEWKEYRDIGSNPCLKWEQ